MAASKTSEQTKDHIEVWYCSECDGYPGTKDHPHKPSCSRPRNLETVEFVRLKVSQDEFVRNDYAHEMQIAGLREALVDAAEALEAIAEGPDPTPVSLIKDWADDARAALASPHRNGGSDADRVIRA